MEGNYYNKLNVSWYEKNKEYSKSAAQMIKVLHLEFSFHKKKIIIKHQHKFDFSALNKIQNWKLLLLVSFIHFICDSPHFYTSSGFAVGNCDI